MCRHFLPFSVQVFPIISSFQSPLNYLTVRGNGPGGQPVGRRFKLLLADQDLNLDGRGFELVGEHNRILFPLPVNSGPDLGVNYHQDGAFVPIPPDSRMLYTVCVYQW